MRRQICVRYSIIITEWAGHGCRGAEAVSKRAFWAGAGVDKGFV